MLDREKYDEACDILEIGIPTPELLAALTSTLGAIAGAGLKPERFDAGLEEFVERKKLELNKKAMN